MKRTYLRKQGKSPVSQAKESDIQRQICDYLAIKNYDFWRSNNVPAVQSDKYGFRMRAMPKYSKKGIPDIFVMLPKRMIFLEVKTPKGKLSPEQFGFMAMCRKNGFEYGVVRSIEDVIECLRAEKSL